MRDRNYTTKDGIVNLRQNRGTQSTANADDLKQKKFSKRSDW